MTATTTTVLNIVYLYNVLFVCTSFLRHVKSLLAYLCKRLAQVFCRLDQVTCRFAHLLAQVA